MNLEQSGPVGRHIHERLTRGFENPECLEGAIQFELTDSGERFYLVFNGSVLEYREGVSDRPSARIAMSAETARQVATGPNLEFANEANWERIQADGDIQLIGALAQLTKVPRADAAERFRLVEEKARSRPPVREIRRVSRPSADYVQEMLDAGQPLIATDLLKDLWPEGMQLDFPRLRSRYGAMPVRTKSGSMSINDVLDAASASRPDDAPYTFGAPAPEELRPLFPPPFLDAARFGPAQIWLGSASGAVSTLLHRDSSPAFLGQIVGRKDWIIISPDQTRGAYARKSWNRDQPCWVDPWNPDYERYPLFRDVHTIPFRLEPGELTIIPPGWFHTVKALDVTFSIGFHYDPVTDFGYVLD
jgi:hypothetical protein